MNDLVDLAQTPDSLGLEDLAKCYTKYRHHNVGSRYHALLILLFYMLKIIMAYLTTTIGFPLSR